MNPQRILIICLCIILCSHASVRAQDMDTELSKLTEDLATKITPTGSKKVTVLVFPDLEGGSTELGKYIAEQLTVNFVMTNRSFSVLDRANLKSILAEHKLTEKGLVDPENAKQLGKFAGVDALITGNIIPVGSNINLTVKVITTETAVVVGAARAKFVIDETVKQFMSKAALPSDSSSVGQQNTEVVTKEFGNLRVVVNKLSRLKDGYYSVSLTFQNKSANNPIAVAMYSDRSDRLRTSLVGADGTQLKCSSDLSGIKSIFRNPHRLTSIDAGGEQKTSITFYSREVSRTVTSFTFQSEIVINQNYNVHDYDNYKAPVGRFGSGITPPDDSLPNNCKVENLVLEIPAPK